MPHTHDNAQECPPESGTLIIRPARTEDAQAIADIDAMHTGAHKVAHWEALITQCHDARGSALVATEEGRAVGYVLGEVRAWEFGSPPSGWIYAIGVHPQEQGAGIGAQLFDAACAALQRVHPKLTAIRTMVRRDDVALLRYFRSVGFTAGPFVELEVSL